MKKLTSYIKRRLALKVSVIYIGVSLVYIFFSDYLVTSLFSDINTIRTISTFKGWGFVIFSGLLIYVLIRQSQLKTMISEERFQLFANLSFEGIVLHKNGIVIDANNAFTTYFGYKLKDIIDKSLEDFFIKEEFKSIFKANFSSQNTDWYNIQVIKKDGNLVWGQIISKPIKHNGEVASVCAIRDISKQIDAEIKLKSNEAFLRSIIENEPECVKILGSGGELKFMNPAGLRMMEVDDLESIKGKCVYPSILEVNRSAFIELCERVFKGESGSLQFQMMGMKGTKLWLETKAVPLYNSNGKIESILGLSQNITERKRVEDDLIVNLKELELAKIRAEEADALKTAFLANMSHEIRTPMNAIMGFSELLHIEDMTFEKRQKFTKIIKDRSKDLMEIINDLLDISRIESHTLKIVETKGNISDKLVEIKEFFETRNEEIYSKPITYELINQLTYDQSFVETDFERIKQVLINLIDNAFKFTAAGKIQLGCQLKDAKTLLFSLSDTGIGIANDKKQIIFERFRQIEEAYLTRYFGGAGLGLSICKGIVELLQGTIWVESELGKGSTFYFTVPYKPIHKNNPNAAQLNTNSFNFHDKTILIVEDMEYNQAYLKELLEETNAKLLFASNGTIALEIFKANSNIDIVLMDIRLPDIHGLDLTKMMINERNDIKIIAQTAYASSDDKDKCFEVGCIDFISKPISQKGLLEMLCNYLNQ